MVDPKFKKRMSLFFKKINLINDDNLLYEVNDLTESFAFERMETDFTTENTSSLFEVMVYSSRETQKMTRRTQTRKKKWPRLGEKYGKFQWVQKCPKTAIIKVRASGRS